MSLIPAHPKSADEVLNAIRAFQDRDVEWRRGRLFSLVCPTSEADLESVLKEAYLLCFAQNPLSPEAFPSLAHMEREIVEMTAALLHAPGEAHGSVTSGGSESNFLAMKTARDWARTHRPDVKELEIVIPASAHPTFDKAAHYLGVRVVRVPEDRGHRADVQRTRQAIGRDTILLVGSAPSWPHGIVDPIAELAELARTHGLLFHVDACVGGFVLPFAKRLGRPVPDFDFSVAPVTSMSADIHKFGYAPKGCSIVLYRTQELADFQPFRFDNWTGGQYFVPTFPGSRPGGAIAAAWAVLNYLGEPGYLRMTERCLSSAERFIKGIRSIQGLNVAGEPHYNLFAFTSRDADVAAIGVGMRQRGWMLGLQGTPPSSLHLTVTPAHDRVVEDFLTDLASVVEHVAAGNIKAPNVVARYT